MELLELRETAFNEMALGIEMLSGHLSARDGLLGMTTSAPLGGDGLAQMIGVNRILLSPAKGGSLEDCRIP